MIKIDFEITRDGHVFRDAIFLPEDHSFTSDDIEFIKEQRFANWIEMITNPPVYEEEFTEEPIGE